MATSPRHAAPAAAVSAGWTPAQAAEFTALRDYRVLQYLSKDRSAFATARRLGYFMRGATSASAVESRVDRTESAPPRRAMQTQTPALVGNFEGNAKQRRSRKRAVQNNAARDAAMPPASANTTTTIATQTSSAPSFAAIARSPPAALQLPPSIAQSRISPVPSAPTAPPAAGNAEKGEDVCMDVEGSTPPSTPSRNEDHARRERELLRDAGATLATRERERSGCGGSSTANPSDAYQYQCPWTRPWCTAAKPCCTICQQNREAALRDPDGGRRLGWLVRSGTGSRRFDEGGAGAQRGKGGGRGRGGGAK